MLLWCLLSEHAYDEHLGWLVCLGVGSEHGVLSVVSGPKVRSTEAKPSWSCRTRHRGQLLYE